MYLLAIGLNHKTANLNLREKLAIAAVFAPANLESAVIVSTCNRTELYLEAKSIYAVARWIRGVPGVKIGDLKQSIYILVDKEAVMHLMSVASGLDSQVLGEVEITGQLKYAYQKALDKGYVSGTLNKLFQSAFGCAKKVRTNTDIGLNPVSIAYLAVRLSMRIFSDIRKQTVLIIGAGDTARLLLQHFVGYGVQKVIIANRTHTRAQKLAGEFSKDTEIEIIQLADLPKYAAGADILVGAANTSLPLVGKGMLETAIVSRKRKPMFIVDLGMPRNIEPQVSQIEDIYLYNLDDLNNIAIQHKKIRQDALKDAKKIVISETERFMQWLDSTKIASSIAAFRKNYEKVRDQSLIEAKNQLDNGKNPYQVLERFSHTLLNRILHQPTVNIKTAGVENDKEVLQLIQRIFNNERVH